MGIAAPDDEDIGYDIDEADKDLHLIQLKDSTWDSVVSMNQM
jgi:hypothetical protein